MIWGQLFVWAALTAAGSTFLLSVLAFVLAETPPWWLVRAALAACGASAAIVVAGAAAPCS